MTYQTVATIAPLLGLFLFLGLSIAIVINTFRSKNKATYKAAATLPLQED